jgi:hypothetical protein
MTAGEAAARREFTHQNGSSLESILVVFSNKLNLRILKEPNNNLTRIAYMMETVTLVYDCIIKSHANGIYETLLLLGRTEPFCETWLKSSHQAHLWGNR